MLVATGSTYRDNDGRVRGKLVGDVDVHVNLRRVVAKVCHLLEGRAEGHGGRGGEGEKA